MKAFTVKLSLSCMVRMMIRKLWPAWHQLFGELQAAHAVQVQVAKQDIRFGAVCQELAGPVRPLAASPMIR